MKKKEIKNLKEEIKTIKSQVRAGFTEGTTGNYGGYGAE